MGEEGSEEHCRHGTHLVEKRDGHVSEYVAEAASREGVGSDGREGRHLNTSGVRVRGYVWAGKKVFG
jgi:hypothetical protein